MTPKRVGALILFVILATNEANARYVNNSARSEDPVPSLNKAEMNQTERDQRATKDPLKHSEGGSNMRNGNFSLKEQERGTDLDREKYAEFLRNYIAPLRTETHGAIAILECSRRGNILTCTKVGKNSEGVSTMRNEDRAVNEVAPSSNDLQENYLQIFRPQEGSAFEDNLSIKPNSHSEGDINMRNEDFTIK